jgi:hypothetical protein
MQLKDTVSLSVDKFLELGIDRIGDHQHREALRPCGMGGGEQCRPLIGSDMAGRTGNTDHPDGIDIQGGHGCGLERIAEATDLQARLNHHGEPAAPRSMPFLGSTGQRAGTARRLQRRPWAKPGNC